MSICVSVSLSVCLSVCLFTFEVPFKGLFAPNSRSPMSKIFRDLESLGKINEKKWSQIWKLLLIKDVKSPLKKRYFLGNLCFIEQDFFYIYIYVFFSLRLTVFLPPLPKVQSPNSLDFWHPWVKVMVRSVLRFKYVAHKGCRIAAANIFSFFLHLFTLF